MLSNYKNYVEKSLTPLARNLSWVNPNALTLIGIIPQALFFIFMRQHHFDYAAVALAFSAVDLLDGAIARTNNQVTAFGGFLGSTVDRISDFILVAAFYAGGLISLLLASVLLVASYLISYVRSRAELAAMGKIKFNYGLIERPERIIFMFLVLILHMFMPHASIGNMPLTEFLIWILAILSIFTLLQRIWHAYKKL